MKITMYEMKNLLNETNGKFNNSLVSLSKSRAQIVNDLGPGYPGFTSKRISVSWI